MPAALLTKDEVLDRLTRAFRRSGYDGTTLALLESATGLKRPSLYHHFPGGKEEMARAVLTQADRWMRAHVIEPLAGPGTPRERLDGMCAALTRFYDSGRASCLLGVMSIGGAGDLFRQPVRTALKHWISALAGVVEEAGFEADEAAQRAEDAVRDIQGALVLSRGLHSTRPFRHTLAGLPQHLLRQSE